MPTKNEVKEIERVFGKNIWEVDELSIPTYIRTRDSQRIQNALEAGRKIGRKIVEGWGFLGFSESWKESE